MSNVEILSARLLAVEWVYDAKRKKSHEALFKEHLRRQALWLNALAMTEDFPTYDLAALVNDKIRAGNDFTNAIRRHLTTCELNSTMILTGVLESALHWAALEDLELLSDFPDLPNPYEPLVILFERHGTFTIEEMFGRYVIGYTERGPSLARGPWQRYFQQEPYVELETSVLNRLDGMG
jgi:hypothetical protein